MLSDFLRPLLENQARTDDERAGRINRFDLCPALPTTVGKVILVRLVARAVGVLVVATQEALDELPNLILIPIQEVVLFLERAFNYLI